MMLVTFAEQICVTLNEVKSLKFNKDEILHPDKSEFRMTI